jgi:ribosomal protein S18 acetylase RimI-like enzyme
MHPAINLCAMEPADAAAVASLIRRSFAAQSVPTDPPASALRVTAEDVCAALRAGGGAVVRAGPALAGSVLWSEKDGGLYVGRLAVDPAWRRQGLARRLLDAAEAAARARALPRVWLETRLVLQDNRLLFAAHGFREVSHHAHPGYASPTFVRMQKQLDRSVRT